MRYRRLGLAVLGLAGAAALAAAVRSATTENPPEETSPAGPAAVAPDRPAGQRGRVATEPSVLIRDVPHVLQKADFCGEACAAMFLNKLGQPVDQDYVFDCSGLDPLEARGCHTKELAAALEHIGFKTGQVWYKVAAQDHAGRPIDTAKAMQDLWKAMHADLAAGVPSIVCTHYDERPTASEHFRLILGYDADRDEVIYHEPAAGNGAYRRMARATLLALWPLKYDAAQWTVVRLRLEPGQLREGKASATFTAADYAQHLMQLKKKVPAKGFTIVIQPPFVVVGDESAAMVRRRAEATVKWAVDKLKAAYFAKDPKQILDIWLFKDADSYKTHCKSIFNNEPTTPYGYFSSAEGALIMDIHTGGGTLVHEIVHPFVAANFPKCPAWFNEGLGSLYEQSAEVDGRIVGRTNWRLAGLQKAIDQKRVPSLKTLCSTTDTQFYQADPGTNYAQARYLCYYLQEHGLLREFYRTFHARRETDPSGYETLKAVLGCDDVEAFQKEWEAYVLKLRFP